MVSEFSGDTEAQIKAPLFVPQFPPEFKLPVVADQPAVGEETKLRPETVPLGEKPRSTAVMLSLVEVTPPVTWTVSVAELFVIVNVYVAAGHPLPPPQSVNVSVPETALAFADDANPRTRRSKLPAKTPFKTLIN